MKRRDLLLGAGSAAVAAMLARPAQALQQALGHQVGPFAALGSVAVPAGVEMIHSSGHRRTGFGAAAYMRDGTDPISARGLEIVAAAAAAGVSRAAAERSVAQWEAHWRAADAAGRYWTLYPRQRVESAMFGAAHELRAGGTRWNDRFGGTDDRLPIQAMIDWAIYWLNGAEVHLSAAPALVGDTLHLGYGEPFAGVVYHSLQLIGAGHGMYGATAGTSTLLRNFAGRPLLNVAGGRGVVLDRFGSQAATKWHREGQDRSDGLDLTVERNWDDPAIDAALGRSLDHPTAPDCMIAIDGYAGSAPPVAYPPTPYPEWFAPGRTQYGKNHTSHEISLFPTGGSAIGETNIVVTCPSGTIDANTDYVRIGSLAVDHVKRIASVGHTQMHGFAINYLRGSRGYEIVANNRHGRGMGRLDGAISNVSYNTLVQLGSIGSSLLSGPIAFRHCYVENGWRVLTVEGGNAVESPILLDQCSFIFDSHGRRGDASVPVRMIGRAGSNAVAGVPVIIRGGEYKDFAGVFSCRALMLFEGRPLFDRRGSGMYGSERLSAAEAVFHNGTAGGIVNGDALRQTGRRGGLHSSLFALRNIDTGALVMGEPTPCEPAQRHSGREFGLPFWAPSGTPLNALSSESIDNPARVARFDKGGFTASATSGAGAAFEWTFANPADPARVERFGGAAGDLLHDEESGLIFLVAEYDRSTGRTRALLQNGVARLDGLWRPAVPFAPRNGAVTALCLRSYVPAFPVSAIFTAGSADATAVQRGDGVGIGAEIAAGDHVDQDDYADNWLPANATRILAYDPVARTLRLTGPASAGGTRRLKTLTRTVS